VTNPLIHRFLEDPAGLEEQELDQLVALLRDDPRKAVELREQLLLDDHLSQKLAIDRQNFFAQIEQRIADFERGEEEMYDHVAELRAIAEGEIDKPLRQSPRAVWLKYSLAAAMALSLVVAIAAWQWTSGSPKAVANIEEISGDVTIVRGKEQIAPQVGKVVFTGDQVVSTAGSTIEWKYKDETTVRVVGDAVSLVTADRKTGAKQVKLDQGELIATVARQPRGPMVFSTPHATATVRGTQLRLVVGRADTQLDVSEGEVELTRLADGKKIDVAANETGVASAERIALRMPQWPLNRSRAIYLFQGDSQGVLCRNPASGNFRESELTPQDGATLTSADDGADITTLLQRSGEFSLELAFVPRAADDEKWSLLSLGAPEEPGIELRRQHADWRALVKGSDGELVEIRVGPIEGDQRVHLLLTGRNGRLAVYVNGRLAADKNDLFIDTGSWLAGPLVLDSAVQRVALFAHFMDAEEVQREWERFKLAHP
jgi:ferric-dicitrate binding protein FerR (iron transport regulator)